MSDAAYDWPEPDRVMTRAEYLAWAEARAGRYERIGGVVVSMAPERVEHNETKQGVRDALRAAIARAGLPCRVYVDGITFPVDAENDYEPDCMVRCGATPLARDAITVPDPIIVVEVLSPSTARTDRSLKLRDYFRVESVQHYLIVWPDRVRLVHHARDGAGVRTATVTEGRIDLSPPGLVLEVAEIYG